MIGCGVVVTASGCVVVAMSAAVVVDAMVAATVVVGKEGGCEEEAMVSDTRLVRRRTLERRKYGGEGKV